MLSALAQTRELRRFPAWMAVLILLGITLLMFGGLFFGDPKLLSAEGQDLCTQYVHWRAFGFELLRQGHLPLWNPHIYCGTPYLGSFQSALLYPLNFPYLLLPLDTAINFGIALHVWIAGVFMFLWTRQRGLHPLAGLTAGILFMFCGPHFLHIYPGHLGGLSGIIWVPLILMSIDGWLEQRTLGWFLLGSLAAGMQVLAGDPQYVFYTAVAAGIYGTLCLFRAPRRMQAALGLAGMSLGGAALSAAQLLTGFDALRGSIRGGALPYDFAMKFAFPPENLLTLVAPGFFGDMVKQPYWGRAYLWEMSLFFSVTGLVLAAYAAIAGQGKVRRFSLTMAVTLFILALGSHTPLFPFLYRFVPGFNRLRGVSKFSLQMIVFLIMLSGIGMDLIIRRAGHWRKLAVATLIAAGVVLMAAMAIRVSAEHSPDSLWQWVLKHIPPKVISGKPDPTSESVYAPWEQYDDPVFAAKVGISASWTLVVAAGILALLAALIACLRFSNKLAYGVAALAVTEVLFFAFGCRATFDPLKAGLPFVTDFVASHPGDHRILNGFRPDVAMSLGANDAWGYAPLFSGRYAQFAALTQGEDPRSVTPYLSIVNDNPLLDLTRLRYVIYTRGKDIEVDERQKPMPRLNLVSQYRVIPSREGIFAAMADPSFDPRKEVILEREPDPAPGESDPHAFLELLSQTTDSLMIEARLSQPAILLITDTWYPGWKVTAHEGDAQTSYQVLPADLAFRAIPLKAGLHRFTLAYAPRAFTFGVAVSVLTGVALLGLLVGIYFSRDKHDKKLGGSHENTDSLRDAARLRGKVRRQARRRPAG